MGNKWTVPNDPRIERCMKNFEIPPHKIKKLLHLFTEHDTTGSGFMHMEDFCKFVIKYPRNTFVDGIPSFLNTKHESYLTFGEFVEIICTFSCFEQWDLLKFMFRLLDPARLGFIEKHELKSFLYRIWNYEPYDNVNRALEYLQQIDEDGSFTFQDIMQLRDKFPHIFYPIYQFQMHVIDNSLGGFWWENHKYMMREKKRLNDLRILAQQEKLIKEKEKFMNPENNEDYLKQKMGIFYYLTPWNIPKERKRMQQIASMEQDLEHQFLEHTTQKRGFISKPA